MTTTVPYTDIDGTGTLEFCEEAVDPGQHGPSGPTLCLAGGLVRSLRLLVDEAWSPRAPWRDKMIDALVMPDQTPGWRP